MLKEHLVAIRLLWIIWLAMGTESSYNVLGSSKNTISSGSCVNHDRTAMKVKN